MWKFKNKQSERHLFILQSIFLNQQPLTLKELSHLLECDIKTVHSTIRDINNFYSVPTIHIDPKTQLIFSDETSDFFPRDIFLSFYENTREFEILEYIFLNGPVTSNDVCENLFISDSTLNRYLSHLRKNLNNYDITIEHNNLHIIGNELCIQNFFVQYYYEKTSCTMFDDFEAVQKVIFSMFKRVTADERYILFRPYFNYFRWIIFVALVRVSKGNLVPLAGELSEPLILEDFILDTEFMQLNHYFGRKLQKIDCLTDFAALFFKETNTTYQAQLHEMYQAFDRLFELDLSESSLLSISNALYGVLMSYFGKSYFLFNTNLYRFNTLMRHFPTSLELTHSLIASLFESLGIKDHDRLYDFIILILDYTPGIYESFQKHEKRVAVTLFLVTNTTHAHFILRLLTERFSNLATFTLADSNTLLTEHEVDESIVIADVATLKSENLLIIEAGLIYSEMPRIKHFLVEQRNQELLRT
ncbi:winged helix-turn-helix transcriptional regulator [Erysipelothrix sp. HDW6C]|uniref:helix-turn-helix domain-containing protein n=1 Tax=Erysipelothrix sp. HDW6C TaxID=2714930 RepID=UPI001408353B|nr:helix-turn-helix domain-containing protein [Erysipelothrix sp. HDW6C]QIK70659.1 winged helix-turn-helix transcriptional regulator [Erysipelothrix sp. HDW6C]